MIKQERKIEELEEWWENERMSDEKRTQEKKTWKGNENVEVNQWHRKQKENVMWKKSRKQDTEKQGKCEIKKQRNDRREKEEWRKGE